MFLFRLCVWQVEDLPIVASRWEGGGSSFLFLVPCFFVNMVENCIYEALSPQKKFQQLYYTKTISIELYCASLFRWCCGIFQCLLHPAEPAHVLPRYEIVQLSAFYSTYLNALCLV